MTTVPDPGAVTSSAEPGALTEPGTDGAYTGTESDSVAAALSSRRGTTAVRAGVRNSTYKASSQRGR